MRPKPMYLLPTLILLPGCRSVEELVFPDYARSMGEGLHQKEMPVWRAFVDCGCRLATMLGVVPGVAVWS